jgi:hypothetical protein
VNKLKASEVKLSAQTEAHKAEVDGLKKKLAEMDENFEVAKEKQEISEMERSRMQKMLKSFRIPRRDATKYPWNARRNCKIVLQRWEHTLWNKNLFVVIPKGLSSVSAKRLKLLLKYSAIVGISALSPVHEGSRQF